MHIVIYSSIYWDIYFCSKAVQDTNQQTQKGTAIKFHEPWSFTSYWMNNKRLKTVEKSPQ